MIQELFGGGSHTSAGELIVGEKSSSPHFAGVVHVSHAPPVSPSRSPKPSTNPKTSSENLTPLRCPRCDSSNTKFCYYNNYNLTQPRHFCKTCRRYWTKGGALRNVPIGGGCRKNNKINNIGHAIPSPLGKPSTAKFIRSHLLTSENNMGKITTNFPNQFDHGLSANSLLWTSPQTSHLLALLRSNHTQNPNPNYNYSTMNYVKQEESSNPYNISNNFWRNNEESHQAELHQQSGGLMVQNVCNQDHHQMYNQKVSLKSADDEHNYYSDTYNNYVPGGLLMGNAHASSSPNCSEILESAPVNVGGQLVSCWNNNTSLPRPHDLPTMNGAYH